MQTCLRPRMGLPRHGRLPPPGRPGSSLCGAASRHRWDPAGLAGLRGAASGEEAGSAASVFHSVVRRCFVLWLHRLCGV